MLKKNLLIVLLIISALLLTACDLNFDKDFGDGSSWLNSLLEGEEESTISRKTDDYTTSSGESKNSNSLSQLMDELNKKIDELDEDKTEKDEIEEEKIEEEKIEEDNGNYYTNSKYNIKLEIPSDMTVASNDELDELSSSLLEVMFESYTLDRTNDIRIAVQSVGKYGLTESQMIDEYRKQFQNMSSPRYTILDEKKYTLGSNTYTEFITEATMAEYSGIKIYQNMFFRMQNGDMILIYLTTASESRMQELMSLFK